MFKPFLVIGKTFGKLVKEVIINILQDNMKMKTQKANYNNGLIKILLISGSVFLGSIFLFIKCKEEKQNDKSEAIRYSYSDSLYFARKIVMNGCEPCHNLKSEPTISKFVLYDFYIMDSLQLDNRISLALNDTNHKGKILGVDTVSVYHISRYIKSIFDPVH